MREEIRMELVTESKRALRGVWSRVSPSDPWTLALVSLVLAAAILAASAIPARRASRMDPVKALRYE